MKKILILTAHYGQGHVTAAKALQEALQKELGSDGTVATVDFVTTFESLMTKAAQKVYSKAVKFTPKLYRLLYHQTDRAWAVKFINLLSQPFLHKKMHDILEQHGPDLIVSTYPVWNYLVQKIRKSLGRKIPFVNIITDSLTVHATWFSSDESAYVVPNEDTAEILRKQNIPAKKIKVLGFPLQNGNIPALKKSDLGFDEKKKLLLVILNTSMQGLHAKKMLRHIDDLPDTGLEILVLTGKNEKLRKYFEKKSWNHTVAIQGWTDHVPAFFQLADVIFTKAGGATVMECIEAGKPMIITQVIPGQEEGNALLIKNHHLGFFLPKNLKYLPGIIREIFAEYPKIQQNLKKLAKPEAAKKIAEYLIGLLG